MQDKQSLSKEQKEAVGLLSIGTFLEYFDLMLFIHMAVLLNELFFPKTDASFAKVLSAIAFCSTYLFRPIGALFFGWLGDNIGRKATVVITTTIMSISCFVVFILPPYAQIGIAAAWIITICRIVQGMSSMGEVVGAQLYLCETIPLPARYRAVAIIPAVIAFGTASALGVASLVTSTGFNWRYAFLIGAGIAVVGGVARVRLRETPDFVDAKKKIAQQLDDAGIKTKGKFFAKYDKENVNNYTSMALFLLDCMWPLCFYFAYVYCGDVLKTKFHFSSQEIIHQNFLVALVQIANEFGFFILLGRYRPLTILKAKLVFVVILFLAAPFVITYATSSVYILILQSSIIFFACDAAPANSVLYRHFPVFKRFTYASFIYALSRAITYVVTAFGFVYLVMNFGVWGTWIITIPVCILYKFGLTHFEKLEIMSGHQ